MVRGVVMTNELQPYPAMKDSGLPWLGEIPEHWDVRRAKYYYREVDERTKTGAEELMSVSHITGVTPRKASVTMFHAASNIGYKISRPGDIAINTMWAYMGALGVTKQEGILSPSYGVYRPRQSTMFIPDYLDPLLRTEPYKSEYLCRSTGITSSRIRLYPDQFLRIPLICPPPDEQVAIVRYLGHIDRRIRRYIRSKQNLIKLLEEERVVMTEAAMRLAVDCSLRIREVADRIERLVIRQNDVNYTPIGLFNRGRGIFHKVVTKGSELGDSTFFWIRSGDLVLSGQFAWEGAVAVAGEKEEGCIASHRYPVLRGRADIIETEYLWSFFRTTWGQVLLDHHSRGAAGRNRPLNIVSLMKEKIPVPPLNIQREIGALVQLESRTRQVVAALIETVREYRTRLIAEIVEGKLDVRAAAKMLPVELHDSDLLDDQESVMDGDDEDLTDGDVQPPEDDV